MRVGSLFLSAVFALGACSSESSKPSTTPAAATPGTAADLDKSANMRATAFCERAFNCCDDASKKAVLTVVAPTAADSQSACESAVKEFLKNARVQIVTALERKDLEFYPSKEADCIKAEGGKTCGEFFALGAGTAPQVACAASFTGKIKDGAACTTNAACESGYCKVETEIGVCTKRVGEGEPCASAEDCNEGLYCKRAIDSKQCSFGDGACKAYESRNDGEACCEAEQCNSRTCSPTNKGIKCVPSKLKCTQ